MPKKDGTPTAAERRDAERIAANHQWIAEAADDILADMRSTMDDADEWGRAHRRRTGPPDRAPPERDPRAGLDQRPRIASPLAPRAPETAPPVSTEPTGPFRRLERPTAPLQSTTRSTTT